MNLLAIYYLVAFRAHQKKQLGINKPQIPLNHMPDTNKVILELTPFTALQILGFMEAMIFKVEKTEALQKSIKEYRAELTNKITTEQLEDAQAEIAVNILMGKHP